MQYLGGKSRIAKPLAEMLNKAIQFSASRLYYEPFAGAMNVAQYVNADELLLSDAHEDLIFLWQALFDGWQPPRTVTEDEYKAAKTMEPSALRGFIGFGCSFGGKWFGGYARDGREHSRSYSEGCVNSLNKKLTHFKDKNVSVFRAGYSDLVIVPGSVIYCDPPYANTTKYSILFDHTQFWDWVRRQSLTSTVFVSEYTAPDDFECVKEFTVHADLRSTSFTKRTEKVFVYRGI